jgi:hypothetical protein
VVDLTGASWNHFASWLKRIDALKDASRDGIALNG